MKPSITRAVLAVVLTLTLIGGAVAVVRPAVTAHRTLITAYFANSNGIFPGDDVVLLGVPIGRIDTIEPLPGRAKVTFWFDDDVKVPADAHAMVLSPQLITSRALQLTPAYSSGPVMRTGDVVPLARTAVPMEFDDVRQQLEKLTQALQPSQPGGVSPLGAFINTTAANLKGQGANIRDTLISMSRALSVLGDHSGDLFSTMSNLSVLVSALQSSTDLMRQLNLNLAAVSGLFTNDGDELGTMLTDVNDAASNVEGFVADNREALGVTSDKLASISQALVDSLDDVKQALHVAPTAFQNFINIYEPAHASLTGVLAVNNFANPITFLCGAIQAASRMGAEQAAKLCVQYLAPIVKNRQYNFPPLGLNPFVNAQARPNEVTYSEDWLRPDYRPTPSAPATPPDGLPPLPAEAAPGGPAPDPTGTTAVPPQPHATNPEEGLQGLMVPPGSGS
jgi:phospholipid/cholesterol/gamma-HCH transport system substrate-binding protein